MTSQKTFFISYSTRAERDVQRAKWAEWVLRYELGHKTIMQEYDFQPGDNFRERMNDALKSADCVIGVLSEDYMKSSNCTDEWTNADHFIPVRFDDCHVKGRLKSRVYIDLNKLDREAAKNELIAKLKLIRHPEKPDFPDPAVTPPEKSEEPFFPVFHASNHGPHFYSFRAYARMPRFTGRQEFLRDKVSAFHKKYPYIEAYLLLIFGTFTGIAGSAVVNSLFKEPVFYLNKYFYISCFLLISLLMLIYFYFKYFSKDSLHISRDKYEGMIAIVEEKTIRKLDGTASHKQAMKIVKDYVSFRP